jgi:hypothetical protein
MKWLKNLLFGTKETITHDPPTNNVHNEQTEASETVPTKDFLSDEDAKETQKKLSYEIQRIKEPKDAPEKSKAAFKAAFNFCRAIRLYHSAINHNPAIKEKLAEMEREIDRLESLDPTNDLNLQRVRLLREMVQICYAKSQ